MNHFDAQIASSVLCTTSGCNGVEDSHSSCATSTGHTMKHDTSSNSSSKHDKKPASATVVTSSFGSLRKLRGVQRSVAELMLDQQRWAGSVEEQHNLAQQSIALGDAMMTRISSSNGSASITAASQPNLYYASILSTPSPQLSNEMNKNMPSAAARASYTITQAGVSLRNCNRGTGTITRPDMFGRIHNVVFGKQARLSQLAADPSAASSSLRMSYNGQDTYEDASDDEEEESETGSETNEETEDRADGTCASTGEKAHSHRERKRSRSKALRATSFSIRDGRHDDTNNSYGSSCTSKQQKQARNRSSCSGYIAPLHCWRRTARCSARALYQWRRVDDMLHDVAQRRVVTANEVEVGQTSEGSGTMDSALSCMSKPTEWAILFDPNSNQSNGSAGSFVSFTREEYEAIFPKSVADASGQRAAVCGSVGAEKEEEYVFCYVSATRLFNLYERFGNFALVADRWFDTVPSSSTSPVKVSATAAMDSTEEKRAEAARRGCRPTAPALCAEYTRVTSALLRRRVQQLEQLLDQTAHDTATNEKAMSESTQGERAGAGTRATMHAHAQNASPLASSSSATVATALTVTMRHPLLTLLRKHPMLDEDDATAERIDTVGAPPLENSAGVVKQTMDTSDTAGRRGGIAKTRRGARGGTARSGNTSAMSVHDTCVAALALHESHPFQPRLGHRARERAREEQRRCVLRTLLHQERIAQVRFNRAAASYAGLCARALPLLQRAQPLLQNTKQDAHNGNNRDRVAQEVDDGTHENNRSQDGYNSHSNHDNMLCDDVWEPLPWSPGCVRQHCPVSSPSSAASAQSAANITTSATDSSSASATGCYTTKALEYEVNVVIPLHCARLVGAARAGWLLPPPIPAVTTVHKDTSANAAVSVASTSALATSILSYSSGSGPANSIGEEVGLANSKTAPSPVSSSSLSSADAALWDKRLQYVHNTGLCNRALSHMSESVLLTLPRAVPLLHREVEQELEKYLLEDSRALMEDTGEANLWTEEIRVVYTQNLLLSRQLHKLRTLRDILRKMIGEVRQAIVVFAEDGSAEEGGAGRQAASESREGSRSH